MSVAVPTRSRIGPGELAELIQSFSEVTSRLEATHAQLQGEVARLKAELGQANEQLERTRRLAALGEMAAGIAHEIRNPLGSIRLYARLLGDDLRERPEPLVTVRKIETAARTLDAIVGDVLTFSREFRVRVVPCVAQEVVARAVESNAHDGVPGWRDAQIVRADLARGPVEFEADGGLVQQALVNVVRNALEAVHESVGTNVACGAHAVTVDVGARRGRGARGGPARVVFSVRDTGPGVTPEVVRRMFNPFFTTRAAGTGLGLAIVHRIVDAHGGRVAVRNNADGAGPGEDPRGATVELSFPARGAPGRSGDGDQDPGARRESAAAQHAETTS